MSFSIMNRECPTIAVVTPCYNEEQALPITADEILKRLDSMIADGIISTDSYLMCVDDGSTDSTWQIINKLHTSTKRVKGLRLSGNCGHQNALLAGLMAVNGHCDACISIDADMQDDPNAMRPMVEEFRRGIDIVYGVRSSRTTDSWFKRTTAHAFYRFQQAMGMDTVYDHADYRLMSSQALAMLSQYAECRLILRGILPQLGLRTSCVEYQRQRRVAGTSKYPLSKMMSLSIDGITSFSARPLRLIFYTGLLFILFDIIVAVYVLFSYFRGNVVPGWSSIMLSIWFVGGVVLMALGIVGVYIGKVFMEVKHRPRYSINEELT